LALLLAVNIGSARAESRSPRSCISNENCSASEECDLMHRCVPRPPPIAAVHRALFLRDFGVATIIGGSIVSLLGGAGLAAAIGVGEEYRPLSQNGFSTVAQYGGAAGILFAVGQLLGIAGTVMINVGSRRLNAATLSPTHRAR
jgi:hypothetical protein